MDQQEQAKSFTGRLAEKDAEIAQLRADLARVTAKRDEWKEAAKVHTAQAVSAWTERDAAIARAEAAEKRAEAAERELDARTQSLATQNANILGAMHDAQDRAKALAAELDECKRQRNAWHDEAHAADERAAQADRGRRIVEACTEAQRDKIHGYANAQLRTDLARVKTENERLRAENARLRESLIEIARPKRGGVELHAPDEDHIAYWQRATERERKTAREALARLDAARAAKGGE